MEAAIYSPQHEAHSQGEDFRRPHPFRGALLKLCAEPDFGTTRRVQGPFDGLPSRSDSRVKHRDMRKRQERRRHRRGSRTNGVW